MPSPVWADLLALALILGFATKGFWLGIIRSVASLVAVVASWGMANFFPKAALPVLLWFGEPNPLLGPWVAKLLTFALTFVAIQLGAFFLTGLFEKVGLGPVNKALGAMLGVVTGVLVGCLPIAAVHALPPLYRSAPVQALAKRSIAWQQYSPMVALVVKPPAKAR